jgi:hypothetical protein
MLVVMLVVVADAKRVAAADDRPQTRRQMGRRPVVRRKVMVLAAIVLGAVAVPAAGAQAASIVFLQDDGNVYLANPDGSGIYQVTLDGDSDPYGPPSQANDGTIVTTQGDGDNTEIVRMTQNGTELSRFKAPFLFHGDIIDSDVSPDGSRIAYTSGYFGDGACNPVVPPAVGTTPCVATRVASSGGADLGGPQPDLQTPSWMNNTRLLTSDRSYLYTNDVGGADTQWFGWESGTFSAPFFLQGPPHNPDVNTKLVDDNPYDAEWNAATNRLAAVTGGAGNRKFITMWTTGAVGSGAHPTTAPTPPQCLLFDPVDGASNENVFADPTWSPDGTMLAWEETNQNPNVDVDGEGIWVWNVGAGDLSTQCGSQHPTSAAIPFGHDPDFGPANVNPAPRTNGGGGGGGGGGNASGGGGASGGSGGGSASGSGAGGGAGGAGGTGGGGSGGGGGGGGGATGSGAATAAIAKATVGGLQLTLMAPGSCVPAGQSVNLAVTSATKKAVTTNGSKLATVAARRKPRYKIKQVTFSLDTSKSVDKRAPFTAAFPSTGLAAGSRHSVGAAVALKKSGSRKGIKKSLSGSISIC